MVVPSILCFSLMLPVVIELVLERVTSLLSTSCLVVRSLVRVIVLVVDVVLSPSNIVLFLVDALTALCRAFSLFFFTDDPRITTPNSNIFDAFTFPCWMGVTTITCLLSKHADVFIVNFVDIQACVTNLSLIHI